MAGTATVTGDIGPGIAVSAAVIPNVDAFKFESVKQLLELQLANGRFQYYDIADQVTITVTKVGTSYDVTVAT